MPSSHKRNSERRSEETCEPRTILTSNGLWAVTDEGKRRRVSDPFQIIANVSELGGNSYGIVVRWKDDRGREKQVCLPLRLFANGANEICARLLDGGLRIDDQKAFLNYIWAHGRTAAKAHLTERTGWFDEGHFVLPDEIIGEETGDCTKIIYAQRPEPHYFNVSGTTEQWRDNIGLRCVGNSRLILAVSCAFAAPLLRPTGGESGGTHLRGGSSLGKTTAQLVAGSVIGGGGPKGFARSWLATTNGLEATAGLHNDVLLILDELSQVDPRDAVRSVYMLGNDVGKERMNRDGTSRRRSEWRVMTLSSGEIGLQQHSGARTKGGAEVRLLDIDADAGQGKGLFENLHGAESPDAFARELKHAALRYYGGPFRQFVRQLCRMEPDKRRETILYYQSDFLASCKLNGAAREVTRAASRLALIAAAGELATEMGITGWPVGEASKQIRRCLNSWIVNRGGMRAVRDEQQAISVVRAFIEQNGQSKFQPVPGRVGLLPTPANEPAPQVIYDRAGYRRPSKDGGTEYLFLQETFKSKVCHGLDWSAALKALDKHGYLHREGRNLSIKTTISGEDLRLYCVLSRILNSKEEGK